MRATLVFCSLGLLGCTTGPYTVTVRSARAPACDEPIETLAKTLPYGRQYPVHVVQDQPLAGVVVDASGQASVPLETMGRYRYLGSIESARARSYPSQVLASLYWMPDMHETTDPGLRALCWAQAPLRALTLGAWAMLSPTSWPCFALYGDDDERHLAELTRAAFAMGANTILVKDTEAELIRLHKTQRVVSSGPRSMSAYAFIDTWAAPAAVELDGEAASRLADVAARCWSLPPSVKTVIRARRGS